ncbi:MAG: site-specific tyrosine recombinase/integron integrase [Syntrophales bacterium]|jgi:integrase/recombinase XerC|nr:tyrosine recombinase XerC [Syntrophales bacterium]
MLNRELEEFIRYIDLEKGYSPRTVEGYRSDLLQFQAFLGKNGWAVELDGLGRTRGIDPVAIRKYLAQLHRDKLKRTSIGRKLAALKSFFRYLAKRGLLERNPAEFIGTPKKEKHVPVFLTVDEVFAILDKPLPEGRAALRNRAMIELLYTSGIRRAELVGLNCADIDFKGALLKVRGKGKKERIVPVGAEALESMAAYRDRERVEPPPEESRGQEDPFFTNPKGRRLSPRTISRIVDDVAARGGVNRKITPHVFRHTFATHLLDGGADLRVIQEMLGHESLSTTQKYTSVSVAKLMKIYDAAHPRSRRDGKKNE